MNSPARAAAQEIAALINRQPYSPSIDQLEAIVAGATTCQDTTMRAMTPVPAVLEWHRILADHDRQSMGKALSDKQWDVLLGTEVRLAKEAFAKPVQSWEDVALLGALCLRWNFPHHEEGDQAEMQKLLTQSDGLGMDQQTLAHVLKAICTMGGFAPGEIPTEAKDDPSLCDLRQRLEAAGQLHATAQDDDASRMADAADREMGTLSERIFAIRPITLHNLKQRAVIAKYWQEHNHHGEAWEVPSDCDAWEHTVMAHLIHGVLQIDAPPDQPSPDLAMFRSALEGIAEFRRINPEPRPSDAAYGPWYASLSERVDGLSSIAERILSSEAPPLDAWPR